MIALVAVATAAYAPTTILPMQHKPAIARFNTARVAMQVDTEGTKPIAAETNRRGGGRQRRHPQLLGLKGAKEATGEELNWKIRLQLTKPATWVPLIWGVACGAAASGNYHALWNLFGDAPTTNSIGEVGLDTVKALSAMVLAGPFMCGFTQTINDW